MGFLDPKPLTAVAAGTKYAPQTSVISKWASGTAYTAGQQVISPSGDTVSAIATHTSGATFNAANWNTSPTYAVASDVAAATPNGLPMGNKLRKLGVIIDKSGASSYDNILVESLTTLHDPESGRIAGVYTGYGDISGAQRGSVVLTYSDDGINWDKQGVLLGASNTALAGDQNGCTGPVLVLWKGLYHLFYIGLTATGYEAGTKTLMLATSPSLKNPTWTRLGSIMTAGGSGWRSAQIWHPNIIRANNKWYCFVNATGADNKESIGYATADQLTGPWTFDDVNSPLIRPGSSEQIAGDPCVTKTPGGWRMDYFTTPASGAIDWYTTTTDAAFPLGWTAHDPANTARQTITPGPAGSFDELFSHKPFITRHGGRTFHYYTAVMAGNTNRRIAAAVDGPGATVAGMIGQTSTPTSVGTFSQVRSAPADANAIRAASSAYATIMGPKAIVQARAGDILELSLAFVADSSAGDLRVDACTYNGATAISFVSGLAAAGHGVTAWGTVGGRYTHRSGVFHYQVQAADVISGTVTMSPVFKAEANGPRTILNNTADPTVFTVRNLS